MDAEQTPAQALRASVSSAGSQSALARICGVTQAAVWKWLDGGKHLPAEHVLKVEQHTGVSRYLLRPDIYPAPAVTVSSDLSAEVASVASNTSDAFDRDRA
jgi:DNA-binding transcriptional regulator YdaS (Cro superfamily)